MQRISAFHYMSKMKICDVRSDWRTHIAKQYSDKVFCKTRIPLFSHTIKTRINAHMYGFMEFI